MNKAERKEITEWFKSLIPLSKVAEELGISLNTAKSHNYPVAAYRGKSKKPYYDMAEISKKGKARAEEENSSRKLSKRGED